MNVKNYRKLAALTFAFFLLSLGAGAANAQIQAAGGGYYVAGYGAVYGSFGQAMNAQRIRDTMRAQTKKTATGNAGARASGAKNPAGSNPQMVVPPPAVVRNHGLFRPDTTVDTGQALADNLAETAEEKALIKRIYTATKAAYEKEAATRGWKNNIAGGLAFFTVTAMTIYHETEEPGNDAANNYFKAVNGALDEMPELGSMTNKDKQALNNTLVGFSGILLAGYSEAKQNKDDKTLATYKKLAGMLIEMVLKTDPENIRLENGQIVMK